jgi:hypothetical protein
MLLLILALLFSLLACSPEQVPNDPIDHFKSIKIKNLKISNKIDLEEYEVYKPWEVKKANGSYYLFDDAKTNIFTVLNPVTGYYKHGVNIGDGPDELLFPRLEVSNSKVMIFDTHRLKRYILVDEPNLDLRVEPVQDIGVEALIRPTFFGDRMAAKGRGGTSWLRYYVDNVLRDSTYFPHFKETDYLSDLDKVEVFLNGTQKFKPDGSKLVVSLMDGCALAIYSCDEEGLNNRVMLEYFPPVFFKEDYSDKVVIGITTKCKLGFLEISCTNDYIFALYSGRVLNDGIFDAYRGNQVLVYDWDGKPVKHYQLETDLVSFDVDAESGILYGIGYDPEACIFEYKL